MLNMDSVLIILGSGNFSALRWEGQIDGHTQRYELHRNNGANSYSYRASGPAETRSATMTLAELKELAPRLPQADWTEGQVPDYKLPSRGLF